MKIRIEGFTLYFALSRGRKKPFESGEVAISTGGARRPDGTMMDMAKPLSFTLDELKEMVSDETHLIEADQKNQADW